MPKVIVNLTDTQIRSAVNSHRKLSTKVQIKLSDGKGLFFMGLDNFITNQKVLKLRYDWVKQVL